MKGYYHALFVRDDPSLCGQMKRLSKTSGSSSHNRSNSITSEDSSMREDIAKANQQLSNLEVFSELEPASEDDPGSNSSGRTEATPTAFVPHQGFSSQGATTAAPYCMNDNIRSIFQPAYTSSDGYFLSHAPNSYPVLVNNHSLSNPTEPVIQAQTPFPEIHIQIASKEHQQDDKNTNSSNKPKPFEKIDKADEMVEELSQFHQTLTNDLRKYELKNTSLSEPLTPNSDDVLRKIWEEDKLRHLRLLDGIESPSDTERQLREASISEYSHKESYELQINIS